MRYAICYSDTTDLVSEDLVFDTEEEAQTVLDDADEPENFVIVEFL